MFVESSNALYQEANGIPFAGYTLPPVDNSVPYEERDYDAVKKCIMDEVLGLPRDGGNLAPLFVRFGFHVGGMYNA